MVILSGDCSSWQLAGFFIFLIDGCGESVLKAFFSEILDYFFCAGLFGLFLFFGCGDDSVLADFEFDGRFKFHIVVLIKNIFVFDFFYVIIIFGKGYCISLRLLIFIT